MLVCLFDSFVSRAGDGVNACMHACMPVAITCMFEIAVKRQDWAEEDVTS